MRLPLLLLLALLGSACVYGSSLPTATTIAPPGPVPSTTTSLPTVSAKADVGRVLPDSWTLVATIPTGTGPPTLAANDETAIIVTPSSTWIINGDQKEEVAPAPNPNTAMYATANHFVAIAEDRSAAIFDIANNKWLSVKEIPDVGGVLGAATVEDRFYVVTAPGRASTGPGNLFELDLVSGDWHELGPVPTAINVGDVTSSADALIVAGTLQGPNNNVIGGSAPTVHLYDPSVDAWTKLPSPPISGQASSVGIADGTLVAWNYDTRWSILTDGGWTEAADMPLDDVECYPKTQTAGPLLLADFCGQAALYQNGWSQVPRLRDGVRPVLTSTSLLAAIPMGPNVELYRLDLIDSLTADCPHPQYSGATTRAFFALCNGDPTNLRPIYRLSETIRDVQEMLELLVGGATDAERRAGLTSGFDVAHPLGPIDVLSNLDADGLLSIIFFRPDGQPWNPGPLAGTSNQLFSFIDPLYATVFSDPKVKTLDMSTICWGEMGCGTTFTRAQWETQVFLNRGWLFYGDCSFERRDFAPSTACTVDGQEIVDRATVKVPADDTLRVRSAPRAAGIELGELPNNATVGVYAAADRAADGGTWRLIRMAPTGLVGWVNVAYLEFDRTPEELALDALIAFAQNPTDATFDAVPFAPTVVLGLGSDLHGEFDRAELRNREAWVIDVDVFRAYDGPIDLLGQARGWVAYRLLTGPHPHCVRPTEPAPTYPGATRISAQPAQLRYDTCLSWAHLEAFVDGSGQIVAVMADLWEP